MEQTHLKILLDENISYRLKAKLPDIFSEVLHSSQVCGLEAADTSIWKYAKQNNLIIVTKDEDFKSFSALYGHPPKVILLKTNNADSRLLEIIIRRNLDAIKSLDSDNEKSLIILSE
ncbi:MAG: DUF5615 family PIN-like protein [Rickettsiales bacterium]